MGNNSAPPKWSKLWIDTPQPSDPIGAYSTKQLERMNNLKPGRGDFHPNIEQTALLLDVTVEDGHSTEHDHSGVEMSLNPA
jgi:hypothetical protein